MMDRLLRIGEASRILGVSTSTLRRWEREGKIKPYRLGKERRYSYEELQSIIGGKKEDAVALYARVSAKDQLEDLHRQVKYLQSIVKGKFQKVYVVKDVASGVKEGRKGILKLIELAKLQKIRAIYITYPDRLTRFGYEYFVEFFKALGVEVIAAGGEEFKEPEKEIAQDFIAILTSFADKLHGLRANKLKKVISELKKDLSTLCIAQMDKFG